MLFSIVAAPIYIPMWQFLKKSNVHLLYDAAIPHLSIYPRGKQVCPRKDLYVDVHNTFICKNPKLETT